MDFSTHVEDYLKNIFLLQARYPRVPTTALAERLDVSAPSVTHMVRKLGRLGMLEHTPYKGVSLTPQGEAAALKIVRAHRLWELYLVQEMGLPWDRAHIEAEQLEHALSDELAERLDEMLGHPEVDPHGHPIPTREGKMSSVEGVLLTALSAGEVSTVLEIRDDTPELLRYLGGLGIHPGAVLAVLDVAPFHGPIHVQIDGIACALGLEAAEHVVVAAPADTGLSRFTGQGEYE